MGNPIVRRGAALLAGLLLTVAAANALAAATDPRELKAREAFAAGRYQDALDLFAKLYAESLHPNYLRNIGRCYQNLGDPDRAITSFRDYLRKAKALPRDEKKEIEGYIAEMEALKKERAAAPPPPVAVTPAPAPTPPPPPPPAPPPRAPEPAATGTPVLVSTPAQAPEASSTPVYGRWWFWAIVGGAVAAGVGAAALAGVFTKTQEPPCDGLKCN